MKYITELFIVLLDALSTGDLRGHLVAWWSVVTGAITPETRFTLPEAR